MNARNKLRVLVTAGPTREYIDPVRYLTNRSSGELGIALARAFKFSHLTLVSVPLANLPGITRHVSVESALEMSRAVKKELAKADVFIAGAAVSDWRIKNPSREKLKRGTKTAMNLKLIANPDILGEAGNWKRKTKRKRPLLVGFALETKNVARAMKKKMKAKNLDLIIGNSPSSFGSRKMNAFWLERNSVVKRLGAISKRELSARIARWTKGRLANHG